MTQDNNDIIQTQEELLAIMEEENEALRELCDKVKELLAEAKGEQK